MAKIRQTIKADEFANWADEQLRKYEVFDSLKKVSGK
jgi:hypothetical protein